MADDMGGRALLHALKERDAALDECVRNDETIARLTTELTELKSREATLSVTACQIEWWNRMQVLSTQYERERNEARSELFLARKEIAALKSDRHDALRRAARRRAG